jgi:bacillithiol biosynthesis cysteine-adding enzyme BshC
MNIHKIDYAQLNYWSHTDLAYIEHDPALTDFYAYEPLKTSIPSVISARKKFPVDRNLLLNVLKKQYAALGLTLPVKDEVILDENSFTITTAHQPTLFTGPLFHIYKIASTIHLANDLNSSFSGNSFIPLFLIGAEDHDWAEVNHFYLFGKKYEWNREASGPSGRLSLEGIDLLIKTISELFAKSLHVEEIKNMLTSSLEKASDYSQFHRLLLHALFGRFGLILLDLDDIELKRSFIPLMEREIREKFSIKYVTATQSALEKAGFKPQAYCRPVNMFYMTAHTRERLDAIEDGIIRADSKIHYSIEEIISELHEHPERFSPNVILRPLYEEFIIPNLVYIGGGGELAYWLERKSQFEAAQVHFPMLMRRNSLLMVDPSTLGQLEKLGLTWQDMFSGSDSIINKYLRKNSEKELGYDAELEMVRNAYALLASKAVKIDPTLSTSILAEQSKQLKQFEQLGSRLLRVEKQQQDTNIKRIQRLKEKLFPEGGLQERHDNFLSFYAESGPTWIDGLVEICDPWEGKFIVQEL